MQNTQLKTASQLHRMLGGNEKTLWALVKSLTPVKSRMWGGRKIHLYDVAEVATLWETLKADRKNARHEARWASPSDVWAKRKYDCMWYLECLDIAAAGPKKNTWPGMPCAKCKKYRKEQTG